MISMASSDAFGGFTFAAFSAKNIPVVVTFMINPSLIESSMVFFPIKATHFIVYFSKVYDLALVVVPVFH